MVFARDRAKLSPGRGGRWTGGFGRPPRSTPWAHSDDGEAVAGGPPTDSVCRLPGVRQPRATRLLELRDHRFRSFHLGRSSVRFFLGAAQRGPRGLERRGLELRARRRFRERTPGSREVLFFLDRFLLNAFRRGRGRRRRESGKARRIPARRGPPSGDPSKDSDSHCRSSRGLPESSRPDAAAARPDRSPRESAERSGPPRRSRASVLVPPPRGPFRLLRAPPAGLGDSGREAAMRSSSRGRAVQYS